MGEGNHIPGNCFQKERDLNILTHQRLMGRTFHFCFSLPTCFAGKNSGGTKSSIGCGGWILWCCHSGLTKEKMCREKPEGINKQQMIINSLHNSLHIKEDKNAK